MNATNSSGGEQCGVAWYRNALQAEGQSPDPPLEAAGVGRQWIPWEGNDQSGMFFFYFLVDFPFILSPFSIHSHPLSLTTRQPLPTPSC